MKGTGPAPIAQWDWVDQETRPAPSEPHGAGSQKNGKFLSFELLETLPSLAVGTHRQKHRPQRHSTRASPLGPCHVYPSRQPTSLPPEVRSYIAHRKQILQAPQHKTPWDISPDVVEHSSMVTVLWACFGKCVLPLGWHQPNCQVTWGSCLPKPALETHFPTNNYYNVWAPHYLP